MITFSSHPPRFLLFCLLPFVYEPAARAVFLVRPFLREGPGPVLTPDHHFWPYVPVSLPDAGQREDNGSSFFQHPHHNFWPLIPAQAPTPGEGQVPFFDVPRHNFWPFVPVVVPGPGPNGTTGPTSPPQSTPPPPASTLPPPQHGELCVGCLTVQAAG